MERVRWAREVVRMKADDMTWPEIAVATGMSQAKCKRLAKDLQDAGDPDRPADPMAPIQRHLDVLEVTMLEASQTYVDAPEGSSVRVGALKLLKESSADWIDMMRLVGGVPRQLGAIPAERQMQQLFREFAELLRDHDASDEMLQALLELAERRLTRSAPIEGRALPAA